jgi:hypothetical protein
LPLVGGSGKDSNATVLGAVRTYARLGDGEDLSYPAWIAAVRAGRTFASNGPILSLSVAGQGPGAVVDVAADGPPLVVRAEGRSAVPFDRLELLGNGTVLAAKEASGNRLSAVVETEVPPAAGWLAARCWSQDRLPDGQCVYAHTSPVYVQVAGAPLHPDPAALALLRERLDGTLAWVRREARCADERQRENMAHVFEEALQVLQSREQAR